ncbi:histidine phosphatase family protein [Actibacterium lipolyticum]|uniref:Bifunctional RNase H/acid phosphatase n=1 Tax=Actibacterium lipolyticum TaxID=1524263 RepID=A0A238KN33_9RHOB|nr:histidine phosphatase family protein [Actibacterium lipolyticum]SMX44249.1 bifunctional RNase H/acid phosphatase [Actibacterium lipolyticum]
MGVLYVIRHAQASFGAADYDVLSDLGHRQSRALGQALAVQGVMPDAVFIGAQRRHRETLAGIADGLGAPVQPQVHAGLNEFDFKGLLDARFRDAPAPDGMHSDRRSHFRTLRDTVLMWQRDEVPDPPETWAAFSDRVADAKAVMQGAGETVLAVSSGGAISQMIASVLQTPADQQIALQLQMKNCAVNRFISTSNAMYLHGFNETPHITAETAEELLTYS